MNLYLISQDVNNAHNTFDSAVVLAESEDEAKTIYPAGTMHLCDYDICWAHPKDVTVEYLGKYIGKINTHSDEERVICSSFNPG